MIWVCDCSFNLRECLIFDIIIQDIALPSVTYNIYEAIPDDIVENGVFNQNA